MLFPKIIVDNVSFKVISWSVV